MRQVKHVANAEIRVPNNIFVEKFEREILLLSPRLSRLRLEDNIKMYCVLGMWVVSVSWTHLAEESDQW
jgi:hypothetical protein